MTPLQITLIILLCTIIAFLSGKIPFSIISAGIILSLILTGVMKPAEALSGFINTNVVMFVAMFVIGAALTKTSLLDGAQKLVVRYKNNPKMLMINKAIAEATEESHKISTLRANGLLDADACAVRMNAISAKLTQLRGERRWLSENEALDETMDAIRKMTAVIKNGPEQMNIFDEDLFDSLVEKVIAESQTRIRFRLCGGLELAEQLEVAAR